MTKTNLGRILLLVIAIIGCSCAGALNTRSHLLPSYLVSNAKSLDGRSVLVSGYVIFGSHARQLWDSDASARDSDIDKCVTLINTLDYQRELERRNRNLVVLRGVVRRDVTSGYVDYGACNDTGLEITGILGGSD